jgi:putative heme iron utilization protein
MEKSQSRSFSGPEAVGLLQRARTASLGTLDSSNGFPFVSLVNLGGDQFDQPVVLISQLSWHSRNLLADPRASVMASELPPQGDALTGLRVTVIGVFNPITDDGIRSRYLARHPEAEVYVDFADFGFWRMEPQKIYAVAGFGRIEVFKPEEVFEAVR